MDTVLLSAFLILAGTCAAVVLAWLAWRKPLPPPDLSPLITRLEALDRAQERTERALREEIARGREESSKRLDAVRSTVDEQFARLQQSNEVRLEQIRATVREGLGSMQQSNEARLEQMRQTVDEKLQGTLEKRLGESFQIVSERLEQVHRGAR